MPTQAPLINHTSVNTASAPGPASAAQWSDLLPKEQPDPLNELQIQAAAEAFGSSAHNRRFGHRFAGTVEDAFQAYQTAARAKSLIPWLVVMTSLCIQCSVWPVFAGLEFQHLHWTSVYQNPLAFQHHYLDNTPMIGCVVLPIIIIAWCRIEGSIPVRRKANLMQWMVATFVFLMYTFVSTLIYVALHLESPDNAAWIGMSMWLTMPPLALQISLQPRAWQNSIGATCTGVIFFSSSALPERGMGAIVSLPFLVWLVFYQEECTRTNFLTTLRNIQLSNQVGWKCALCWMGNECLACC